jgi:hypothetical protein
MTMPEPTFEELMANDPTQDRIRKMIKELLADESDQLSSWECEFLDDMHRWTGDYTLKQAAVIERIWIKVFGN